MNDITRSTVIDAPPEAVWPLITRFDWWPTWGPTVSGVTSASREVAPQVRGRVTTPVGVSLPFEITEFEAGHNWSWRVAGRRATGHRIELLPDGRTNVVFTAPAHWGPYGVVLSAGLRRLKALAEGAASSTTTPIRSTGSLRP